MDTPTPSCFAPRYEVGKRYAQWLHIPLQPQSGHWIVGRLTEVHASGWYTLESEDHTVVTGPDVCGLCPVDELPGIRTTLDAPELIWHGRRHHKETIVHLPAMPMLQRLVFRSNGPPTRLLRWCCEEYKEVHGRDRVLVFGVRAAESQNRKANWKLWQPVRGKNKQDGWILNPIIYWTDEDVWTYTRQNGVPYCSLYDEGFTRLGCVGCPMAGDGRKAEFARWPKYEQAWKRAIRKFYETWHGVPREDGKPRWFDCPRKDGTLWTTWEDMWRWWMEELPEPDDDDCQMGLF